MEGWNEYKLKDFINVDSGAAFKSEDFTDVGIPVVKIGNINNNTIQETNDDSFIALDRINEFSEFILKENDVLIAMSGNTTCKMGRVPKTFSPSLVNQRVGVIKVKEECKSVLSLDFVFYLLSSDAYQQKLWNLATATGQPNLSPRDIKKIMFLKPSLPEQKSIAKILSTVDDAIRSTNETIQKLERVKKSLMQKLLSGKMKPNGTMRTVDEFYEDEKMGLVPKGWKVKAIGEMFESYPTASYSRSKLFEQGDCKYIHYGDIHTKFDRFLDVQNTKLPYISDDMIKKFVFLKDGDLIIADTSEDYDGVGKLVEIANTNNTKVISGLHTLMLRSKTDDLINGYKGYLFNEYRVRLSMLKYVTGIKVYSISKGCLTKVLVSVPPIEEQKEIKQKLDSVGMQIQNKQEKIAKIELLKKSLMQQLLTGKVRVEE